MAGERKGKTYEALVGVALEMLRSSGELSGGVFWNETPAGMTIEPDFTIGPDKDHPTHIFLISHSAAAGNSHMKFWRNIGELAEAKTLLPTVPRVYSITFDSVIKDELKVLQNAAFDGQLIVGDLLYGSQIQAWVDSETPKLPADDVAKKRILEQAMKENGLILDPSRLIQLLSQDLRALILQRRNELDALWAAARTRASNQAPPARDTRVRRGLSKLLIFDDLEMALRLYRGEPVGRDEVPSYAFELGLARESIVGPKAGDPEISNAVGLLDVDDIRKVIQSAPLEAISSWLITVRNTAHVRAMGDYVCVHYDALCSADVLVTRLSALREDPAAIEIGADLNNWPPRSVWLFEFLLALIRLSTGSGNGYGYAPLGRDVVASGFKSERGGSQTRLWWIVLPDWVHRRGAEVLEPQALVAIAKVLAEKLSALGKNKVAELAGRLPREIATSTIEAKLVTYRGFSPLFELLKIRVPDITPVMIRAGFAEAAGLEGQGGRMQVAITHSTLINWQSAHGSHTNDKKKELCGRAVALRYSWDAPADKFISRPGIKKLILIVDGTWRQTDLDALARAGWDEIFYPDEMDKLVAAIV